MPFIPMSCRYSRYRAMIEAALWMVLLLVDVTVAVSRRRRLTMMLIAVQWIALFAAYTVVSFPRSVCASGGVWLFPQW